MKRTLLEMVQSIINDMDSEAVTSISETEESLQVASIIEDVYFALVSNRVIPEHRQLIKLTKTTGKPTHFTYPINTKEIVYLSYDVSGPSDAVNYREIKWCDPLDFLSKLPSSTTNTDTVTDVAAGTTLYITNNRQPNFYTSFDDDNIVLNSYDSSIESVLNADKTRAYGTVYPTFTQSDSFEPDLDDDLLSYLLAEAKSTAMSLMKGGSDPKIEQTARRLKAAKQNDRFKTKRENKRPLYGRQ